jgi:D-alanyl-D-alanine carboxypeptidase/D-alanyl-D-alanine-endopeptidase (penicillin-binding protein 4)
MNAQGETLHRHQAEKAFLPASTLKTVVTAAALDLLGPDYRFRTRLFISGTLADSVLQGDVWLLGSDRPGLPGAEALLGQWVSALKAAGIARINGRIIGDGRFLGVPELPGGWSWDDLGNYYAPVVSGLTFDENRFALILKTPPQPGYPNRLLRVTPDLPGWQLINESRAGQPGSGDQCYFYTAPGMRTIYARGTLPPGQEAYSVEGAWPDPDLAAAQRLWLALEAAGVSVSEGAASALLPPDPVNPSPGWKALPDPLREVWVGYSPALRDLVRWTNQQSLNGYAETLLRALGQQAGDPSVDGGRKALQRWLETRVGLSDRGWQLDDGSGLSRRNSATPSGMTYLMVWIMRQTWAGDFEQSLAQSGQSGTLRNFMVQAPGRVLAKSGSIQGTRAYVGYVLGLSGQRYPFYVVINGAETSNATLKSALEPLFQAMLQLP